MTSFLFADRPRAARGVAAVASAAALLLSAGCSSGSSTTTPAATSVGASQPGGLAALYRQKLDWHHCAQGECASLRVPLDYANPTGPTIGIAINRMKATGAAKGALVVNPGGPGGSGVDYAAAADNIVSASVRKSYDIVGFDPRGVQRSAAIICEDDAQLDKDLGDDPAPTSAQQEDAYLAGVKASAQACGKNAGPLLPHVSTAEAAHDMDLLRAALGQQKLDYLGKSYGTLLGATYAEQFPKNVGRMVLDGVLPPDLSMQQINEGQAKGFELALDSYLADCVAHPSCRLGTSQSAAKAKLTAWLKGVDTANITVHGDARISRLTQGWAVNGIADGLYDKGSWSKLSDALSNAMSGDGTKLMGMADDYASRNSDGTYDGNIMQAINAVTCLDRPAPSGGKATYEKDAAAFAKEAPTWGAQLAWASAVCAAWPVKATGTAHRITAAGSAPILVVGTRRDPATPYAWSVRLADELQNARLLTFDGDGHTAYHRYDEPSSCVDGTVDGYLVDGKVPQAKNTSC